METKRIGAQTLRFSRPPRVESFANIGAKLEGQGPLADYFDELSEDSFFGEKTWEKGEARMQKRVLSRALEKATRRPEELDLIFAGDLLNQCIGTSFALREFGVPLCGVYGACSTMGESLALAAMSIDGGFARRAAAMTSSHFCTAERQYRMPVPYGSQRTPTAQWTATAAGCCILSNEGRGPAVTHAAIGRIVDRGITDANNMGAAMAPAAYDTLRALFSDTRTSPADYDLIVRRSRPARARGRHGPLCARRRGHDEELQGLRAAALRSGAAGYAHGRQRLRLLRRRAQRLSSARDARGQVE